MFSLIFIGIHVKCPSVCRILIQLEFSQQIVEKTSNFVKIRPVEAELFHEDRKTGGQRYMMHLIVAFHYLAKAPKNSQGLMTCSCLINVPNVEVPVP